MRKCPLLSGGKPFFFPFARRCRCRDGCDQKNHKCRIFASFVQVCAHLGSRDIAGKPAYAIAATISHESFFIQKTYKMCPTFFFIEFRRDKIVFSLSCATFLTVGVLFPLRMGGTEFPPETATVSYSSSPMMRNFPEEGQRTNGSKGSADRNDRSRLVCASECGRFRNLRQNAAVSGAVLLKSAVPRCRNGTSQGLLPPVWRQ